MALLSRIGGGACKQLVKSGLHASTTSFDRSFFTIPAIHQISGLVKNSNQKDNTTLNGVSQGVQKDHTTPPKYVSQGPSSGESRKVLDRHVEEQKQQGATEACSETVAKMSELEDAISSIIGLEDIKLQLRTWGRGMLLDEERRSLGLDVGPRKAPNMAFLGNPGTGKTMVARVLGKLLHLVGILPKNKVTEVQRTDLVGKHVGSTGIKTKKKIKQAEGGILFVDEAYRLVPFGDGVATNDSGIEALEEIMSVMESGKVVVILAGYNEPMKRVMSANEGLRRRVTKFFHFRDYNTEEISQIVHAKMNDQAKDSPMYGFKLHPSCSVDAIAKLIERGTTEKLRKQMNGGLVAPMLQNARENLDVRLDFDSGDAESLLTITMEDLEAGLISLRASRGRGRSSVHKVTPYKAPM